MSIDTQVVTDAQDRFTITTLTHGGQTFLIEATVHSPDVLRVMSDGSNQNWEPARFSIALSLHRNLSVTKMRFFDLEGNKNLQGIHVEAGVLNDRQAGMAYLRNLRDAIDVLLTYADEQEGGPDALAPTIRR